MKIKNEEQALKAAEKGEYLENIPEKWRTPAVCMAAVKVDWKNLKDVPKDMQTEAMCLAGLRSNTGYESPGKALEYVADRLKTSEICREAVGLCGYALQFVPVDLKTLELCELAVAGEPEALEFVPDELKTEDMCLSAVGRDAWTLHFVPERLRGAAEAAFPKAAESLKLEKSAWRRVQEKTQNAAADEEAAAPRL